MVHTGRDGQHATAGRTSVDLAEGDAAVLILGGHLLPLLDLGDTGTSHGLERVGHSLARLHVAQFDERNGNETGTTETTDGFGDEPLGVGLGDDDDSLAGTGIQLVGPLGLEVILDDAVDHGALTFAERGHSEGTVAGGVGGGVGGGTAVGGETRVVVVLLGLIDRTPTIAFVLADNLEEGNGHEAAGTGDERVAGLVPVVVVLTADDVKEVALAEGQFLGGADVGNVVVEGFDHLRAHKRSVSGNFAKHPLDVGHAKEGGGRGAGPREEISEDKRKTQESRA